MFALHSALVHGGWSAWGGYGSCTKSCGGGTQTRQRQCSNPAPAHGGRNCAGASSESKPCNVHLCPGKLFLLTLLISNSL